MLDLTKKVLPDSIIVEGKTYFIHTDFSYWINFSKQIHDKTKLVKDFDFLYVDEKPEDRLAGFRELMNFYLDKHELPRATGEEPPEKTMDYALDADLIYAAFMQQYNIDLLEAKLHWWKFQALFFCLKDTKFTDILSYRAYNPNDKSTYKDYMRKMHEAWQIESPATDAEKEVLERFNSL